MQRERVEGGNKAGENRGTGGGSHNGLDGGEGKDGGLGGGGKWVRPGEATSLLAVSRPGMR